MCSERRPTHTGFWHPGFWLVGIVVCFGCGEAALERAAIHGRVTFRGKPIEDGAIVFSPLDVAENAPATPAGGKIVGGAYSVDKAEGPLVGRHRVEIHGYRKTGRKIPDLMGDASIPNRPLIEEVVPMVPATFNIDSSLTADVAPGDNTKDFEL